MLGGKCENPNAYTDSMERFRNRSDAGRKLVGALEPQRSELVGGIVLAIPRGGIVVGAEIARAFMLRLKPLVVAKIGAPGNPEYALGAVGPDGQPVFGPDVTDERRAELAASLAEAQRKVAELTMALGRIVPSALRDRPVIVTDDGIATGRTVQQALAWVRHQHPSRIIVAVPVMPRDAVPAIESACDQLVVLLTPDWFSGVAAFYDDFPQVSTTEAREILTNQSPVRGP